jgi:hypothetical protein
MARIPEVCSPVNARTLPEEALDEATQSLCKPSVHDSMLSWWPLRVMCSVDLTMFDATRYQGDRVERANAVAAVPARVDASVAMAFVPDSLC